MVSALSLLLSVLLVSSTTLVGALDERSRLFFRDVLEDFDECKGAGWENDMLARFTGIFFGDFYTGGSQDILGALAVEGNMHAPNYIVNANHGSDCSNVNSLNSYGLVVGGQINTFNTHVHGSAYIAGGGSTEEILQLDDGCFVTSEKGTGIFDFALVKDLLQSSSQDFANHPATVILESDGTITELCDYQLALYEFFTFHTCSTASCSADRDTESDSNAIFFNISNWNGVQGTELNPAKTYVLNIPVTNGGTFELTSNNPSNGFNPCNVILNVYPVDENSNYMPAGEITFLRKSASQLGGVSLAPRAHIVDGSTGNSASTIVGLDYTWENLGAGVEIHTYESAGGNCDQYLGCVPNHVTTTPSPVAPPTQTSITKSRTRTWPFTRLPTFKPKTATVTYQGIMVPTIGATLINVEKSTTTETTIITTSVPLTTALDITTEITTSVPVALTSDSETITAFSETTETITDPTSTFETITILTTETTKVVTTTETEVLETISDTTCLEDNTNIVTIDSAKTETFDSITDFVTATEAAHPTTVTVATDIFITTETDNILSVTEYTTSTRRQLMLKPVTRTKTECNGNICVTTIVTDGSVETCTDEPHHGHHHGHHHGPGEKCEEVGDDDEDEEDDDEENKHYHKEGKKES